VGLECSGGSPQNEEVVFGDPVSKVQGDLEWVYVIENMADPGERRHLSIYKTAPGWGDDYEPFIWKVWGPTSSSSTS